MLERLKETLADHPFVGNVRGIGLIIGVEFVADMKTRWPFAASSYPHRIVANYAFELAYSIIPCGKFMLSADEYIS